MSLDPILEKIADDARREAEAIEGRGRAEADRILEDAAREAEELRGRIVEDAASRIRAEGEKELSAARLRLARSLLSVRRECLEEVLVRLPENLVPESAEEYASFLASLAAGAAEGGPAELQVGSADVERFGGEFGQKVLAAGKKLRPDWQVREAAGGGPFPAGLRLRQENAVHDLSLSAIAADARELVEGAAARALFAE
jgi:vacuolar-type H+-ATPase subunit E/Vma4